MEQTGLQHCSSIANTVKHVILRVLDAEFAVPPDCFLEGGGRRVNDDLLDQIAVCKGLKIGIILFIGLLLALLAAVVVILFHHKGRIAFYAPEPEDTRIERAIVAANVITTARAIVVDHVLFGVKEGINKTLSLRPLSEDIPSVEDARIHTLVALLDLLGKAEVISHREMQVKDVPALALKHPFFIEPVHGAFGVTVKPELAPRDRASGESLLNEGPRHKRDLVKKNACQGHALNKRITGFVTTSEEVIGITAAADRDNQLILCASLGHLEKALKPGGKMHDHIAAQRLDRTAANGEALIVERVHAPKDKADRH